MSRFFLTTAIDFVNSRPHLGTAYEKVCADVIARYKRLCGFDTRFLMGNDEHSQNVYKRAMEEHLDPLAYCDRMEQEFRRTWQRLDLSFDDFIRTTQPRHAAGVTNLIQRIYDAGDIYEGVYEGWYCVSCEEFKQEKDLVNGNCPLHPTLKPEWIREKNYFFRLSKYQQPLRDHFAAHPEFMQPENRRNEILRLIEMSSRPASSRRRISLRRISGSRNEGFASKCLINLSRYFESRKKKFFSRIHSGVSVGWTGHLPSTRSFSGLNASHETQYHPS